MKPSNFKKIAKVFTNPMLTPVYISLFLARKDIKEYLSNASSSDLQSTSINVSSGLFAYYWLFQYRIFDKADLTPEQKEEEENDLDQFKNWKHKHVK